MVAGTAILAIIAILRKLKNISSLRTEKVDRRYESNLKNRYAVPLYLDTAECSKFHLCRVWNHAWGSALFALTWRVRDAGFSGHDFGRAVADWGSLFPRLDLHLHRRKRPGRPDRPHHRQLERRFSALVCPAASH